ncbi:zinc finger protein 271-like [Cydia strobilella]|uniref:zinc finger protein 271-like n=1 Tax=Cydia strobilella TaxID=1100964 RepID=UPI0030054E09
MVEVDVIDVLYLCRCCLRRPPDKDLMRPYRYLGRTEIYADILAKCFDIRLSLDIDDECGICEVCVGRLREASDFKLQVQRSQAELRARLDRVLQAMDEVPEAKSKMVQEDAKLMADDDFILLSEESSVASKTEMAGDAFSDEDVATLALDSAADAKAGPQLPVSARATEQLTMACSARRDCLRDDKAPNLRSHETPQHESSTHMSNNAERVDSPCQTFIEGETYQCDVCKEQFVDKNNLTTHILIHTVNDGEGHVNCDSHNTINTSDNGLTHRRPDIEKELVSSNVYEKEFKNLNAHLSKREKSYSCDICQKEFDNSNLLMKHKKNHIWAEKEFICDVCKKSFSHKTPLITHMRVHTREKPYVCEICNKKFSVIYSLQRHLKLHARDEQKCEYQSVFDKWEKEYTTKHNLIRQIPKCNICLKQFAQKETLDAHLKSNCLRYFCDFCKNGFRTKYRLTLHIFNHMGIQPYPCEVCQKRFTQKSDLDAHLRCHIKYTCGICHKGFIHKSMLSRHLLIHGNRKHYSCKVCKKQFQYKSHFNVHLISLRPGQSCGRRHEVFESKDRLNHHLNTHMAEKQEKQFVQKHAFNNRLLHQACNYQFSGSSEKVFKRKRTSDFHLKTHKGIPQYFCDVCKKEFTEKDSFLKHTCQRKEGTKYSRETNWCCEICGKQVKSHAFINHRNSHMGVKPFACNFCPNRFTCETSLKRHIRTHTGEKPFSCVICHKRFGRSDSLRDHMLIHSGLKPQSCKVCNKQFRLKNTLDGHVQRIHTGEKRYTCDVCQKRFHTLSDLKFHYPSHTGEKPYVCEICNKKFALPKGVKKHLRNVHKEGPSKFVVIK